VNPLLVLICGAIFVYFGVCNRHRWQGLGLIGVGLFLLWAALVQVVGGWLGGGL
jgi:hypothetical protein